MKIAILGWGSLIWQPKDLKIQDNKWFDDGIDLPIEFARISDGEIKGRLTLVIKESAKLVKTLYCISTHDNLAAAKEDLRIREGNTKPYYIGSFKKRDISVSIKGIQPQVFNDWLENKDIDAVIWTNIPSNLDNFKVQDALDYLHKLIETKDEDRKKFIKLAEQYIRCAPKVVRTPVRDLVEKELNWMPCTLLDWNNENSSTNT